MTEYKGRHSVGGDGSSEFESPMQPASVNHYSRRDNRSNGMNWGSQRSSRSYQFDPEKVRSRPDKGNRKSIHFGGYDVDGVRKKSNPSRSIIISAAAIVVFALLVFGGFKLIQSFGAFGPTTAEATEVSIFVPSGSTTSEIAKILKKNGVISSESSFVKAVQGRGVENQLQPGQYTLMTNMDDKDVIDSLIGGPLYIPESGIKLTIPEGLTIEQTARIVENVCGIPASEFIAEAYRADKYFPDYPSLNAILDVVYNNSMEGFLYPKTYMIPEGSNAEYVIRVLLSQFVKETQSLDMSYAEPRNLDLFDIVILASMIEKETAQADEKALVSSVMYNRLHYGMPMQICATVIYAMGVENYDGHPLLESDLATESPYNTYLNYSLPAGPICSPHLSSIIAAAHPAETDYFYYVLTSVDEDGLGRHTFCETEEDFWVANELYHELFNVPN